VPPARWAAAAFSAPAPSASGRLPPPWGGFVSAVAAFAAAFFGLPPRAAVALAPPPRLLLAVAWAALAPAGLP
ncbi:hypothetical protein C3R44_22765, partial [Mycobacterium tuberculosis]